MTKIYIANGKKYKVGPNSESKFLTDFPEATLFEGPLTKSENETMGKEESILPSASVEEKPALDMESNSVDILLGLAGSKEDYAEVENNFVNTVKDNNKEKLAAKLEELVKTYDAGRVENGLINPGLNAPNSQIYQDRLAKVNKGYNDYLNFLLQSDYNRLAKKRKEELTPEIEQSVAEEQEGGFFTGFAAKAAGFFGYAIEDTGLRTGAGGIGLPVIKVEKVGSVDIPRTENVSLGINNEKYLNRLKNLDQQKQRIQQMLDNDEISQRVFEQQINLLYTDPTLSSGQVVAKNEEEYKAYINNKVEENNKRIVDNLIKTNERELKIIEKFGEEPVFTDEEGNIDLSQFTGKNIGRAVGAQGFQVLNSLLTMFAPGSGEYFQEAGASMSSALYKLAEEKAKAKNTTIDQLSEAERMDIFEGIIENHELDYSAIQKNAMASAGIGTLGNFVQIFKIGKAIPVPVLNQIINGNFKRAIKNIGIKGLTYTEATIAENVTEQFQNYFNAQGVADATGLEYKFDKREAIETAVQTTLTTPLLVGGGRSVKGIITEGRSRIQGATDPKSIRAEFNRQTEAVKILKENGSITEKQAADQIDVLYAAERELDASVFSKYEAKPRAEYYNLLIKEGQLNKRLEELKTTYKADDVFSAGETQSVENELSSIANKKIAINAQQQSKITLKKFVPYLNANGNLYQKDGVDLKAYKFKTTEELTNFLKGRGYSEENISRMQNEIGAYDSKTHSMFFSEETLDSVFKDAIETGVVTDNLLFAGNVVHHEFGHALMVTMSDSDINTLIKNVRVETEKLPDNSALKLAFNAARKRVRKDYGDSDNRTKSEELISSISDFMSAFTEVTVDEAGFLSRVGKIIGDALDNNAPPFMDFSELQDPKKAKEFFVKYNSFIGQKRKSIPAAAIEGAVRNIKIDDEEELKFSKQELASEKVQQIYDEQGEAGAMDIIDLFKPITTRLANKYRDVPGFDFELLQSEIELGKRGLFDLIQSYNPDKGVPLAAHINTNLSRRAIEAAQRILKTDFELDVTESKGVVATETAEEIVERQEAPVEPAAEIKSLRKEIGLPNELVETVKNAVVKTFGTKLPSPEDPKFRLELQKRFRTELKKPIAKFVGTRANYENFLRDNFEAIYDKLPQSLLNKRFDEFIEPVLGEDGKQLREKTAEGNKIFTKKKISKAEFIKYFLGAELGSSTKGARKTTIVEAIAEEMAFDATMEVLSDPDVSQKYQDIAELTDQPLPENFKALVAKQVDRVEDFKFSKALSNVAQNEYNLNSQELATILNDNNLNELSKKYSLLSDNIIYKADPESIKFSLNTKEKGNWVQDEINALDNTRKVYGFKVKETDYDIRTFRYDDEIDFEIFEQTEGLKEDAIVNDPKSWGIAFMERKTASTATTGAGLLGLTNQFKVFGTVANATIDLIKKENLNSITFTAQGNSRIRLYNSLAQKFAKELNWSVYNFNDGEGNTIFIAYKPEAFGIKEEATPGSITKSIANDLNKGTVKFSKKSDSKFIESASKVTGKSVQMLTDIFNQMVELGAHTAEFDNYINKKYGFSEELKKFILDKVTHEGIIQAQQDARANNLGDKYEKALTNFLNRIYKPQNFKVKRIKQRKGDLSITVKNADGKKVTTIVEVKLNKNAQLSSFSLQNLFNENGVNDNFGFSKDTTVNFAIKENILANKEYLNNIFNALKEHEKATGKKITILRSGNIKLPYKEFWDEARARMKDGVYGTLSYESGPEVVFDLYEGSGVSVIQFGKSSDFLGGAYDITKGTPTGVAANFNKFNARVDNVLRPARTGNNIYFRVFPNVKNMLVQPENSIETKEGMGKFMQSKRSLSSEFNGFIEQKTGIDKRTKISEKRAAMLGEGKGRFKFFLPPNAEDFMGLLYTTLLPGKRGDEQIAFYKEQLVDPFARGIRKYQSAKEQTIRELKALKKAIKKVPTKLAGKNETGFTNEVAVRVYLWNKNGYEVPGLKKKEVKDLVRVVANNSDLREFALNINSITRGNGYPEAENNWEAGTITTDLLEMLNTTTRKESLAEFINNKDQIFSKDNLNKLQAAFGKDYRFALEDALGRMVSGRKRYTGIDKDSKKFLDWLNGAVGTIMFWNSRSAILQMLSVVNYTNFSDNNIFNQVKTFANQKQYWTDWHTLMFSDFLKQRRAGSQLDVNINDIIEAAEGSTNPGKAIFAKLIRLGYAPTQIADSFAISTGGAAFYRNRINKYKKDGLSDQEAKDKAFLDFQEITEETQQSSRDDRISQIQAGGLGRVIFAFANTPMQYARIIKRATQDLVNGRGDWKQNISRIAFYGFLQNVIFSTLQSGLFALLIDGEDDDEVIENKVLRGLNNTADTLLRGSGLPGAVLSSVKNAVFEVFLELKKDRPQVWKAGLNGATSISPPVNSKVRKIVGALDRLSYKSTREDIMTKGFSLENPVFDIGGKLTSAITNAPADRLLRKTENIVAAMDEQTSATQALFLTAGWSKWDLNMVEDRPQKLKLEPLPKSSKKLKRSTLKRKSLKR